MWSIVDAKTNRVAMYAETLAVRYAEFRVSQKIRDRVVKNQRKEVHARVWGILAGINCKPKDLLLSPATYNPYVAGYFYTILDDKALEYADYVYFTDDGKLQVLSEATEVWVY
jgi:hypothetical protein